MLHIHTTQTLFKKSDLNSKLLAHNYMDLLGSMHFIRYEQMLCRAAAGLRTRSLAPCLASCARSFGFFVRSGASAQQIPCYHTTPAL